MYKIHSNIINKTKDYIKTALGISKTPYSIFKKHQLYKTEQGAGSYNTNGLYLSVHMMQTIRQTYEGCYIEYSRKNKTWTKHVVGIVDNTRQHAHDWTRKNSTIINKKINIVQIIRENFLERLAGDSNSTSVSTISCTGRLTIVFCLSFPMPRHGIDNINSYTRQLF